MKKKYESQNSKLKGILALIGLIILFIILIFPISVVYNNWMTDKFLTSLVKIELPNNTKAIDSFKHFGILDGNSNHCDCKIAVLFETEIETNKIENQIIKNISLNYPYNVIEENYKIYLTTNELMQEIKNGVRINTYILNDAFKKFEYENYEFSEDISKMAKAVPMNENKNYFLITSFDQTFSGFIMNDPRCN